MTVADFRNTVHDHLRRAMAAVPSRVPEDVVTDPCADELMKHLNALTDLLYDLGSEAREKEHSEHHRKLKIEAKRQNPQLEQLAMRIDERVQHASVVLGSPAVGVIASIEADMCIAAFVAFLDAFPATAFAVNRSTCGEGSPSHRDISVASIIAVMRIRKGRQNNGS